MAVIILLNHNFVASLDVDARLRGLGLEAATVEGEPGEVRVFGVVVLLYFQKKAVWALSVMPLYLPFSKQDSILRMQGSLPHPTMAPKRISPVPLGVAVSVPSKRDLLTVTSAHPNFLHSQHHETAL